MGLLTFRRITFAVILILLGAFQISMAKGNSLKAGTWSLQFGVDNDFQPTSFQGALFCVKRHYSDNSAIRLGVSLRGDIDNTTRYSSGTSFPYESLSKDDIDSDFFNIDFILQYLHYPSPRKQFNAYMGIGPHYQCYYDHDKIDDYDSSSTSVRIRHNDYKRKILTLGVAGTMGVEWFFVKSASLMAEYNAQLDHEWYKYIRSSQEEDGDPANTTEEKRNSWTLNSSSVRFGLSVYF